MPQCPECNAPLTASRKGGWFCEDCAARFGPDEPAPTAAVQPTAAIDLDVLPFPVAYPLAFALDDSRPPSERLDNVIFTAYQAMRTTALLILADYLACETASRKLEGAVRGLRMPHWGEWSVLCDQLYNFWSGALQEKPERPTHFLSLVTGWKTINRKGKPPPGSEWKALLVDLPGMGSQMRTAQSANEALWKA
jgi:hypothetical protein